MDDFKSGGPSQYSDAVKRWASLRGTVLEDALAGLSRWDRLFIRHAETLTEYQQMRRSRLSQSVRWVVAKRIKPS